MVRSYGDRVGTTRPNGRGRRVPMSNRVFCDISISADGYLAGPGQTADKPFGDGPVDRLHAWMFDTPDENQAEADRITAAGAFVMGRNMFGPIRGDWDPSWR